MKFYDDDDDDGGGEDEYPRRIKKNKMSNNEGNINRDKA